MTCDQLANSFLLLPKEANRHGASCHLLWDTYKFFDSPNFLHIIEHKLKCWKLKEESNSTKIISSEMSFTGLNHVFFQHKVVSVLPVAEIKKNMPVLSLGPELGCCNPDILKDIPPKGGLAVSRSCEALFYTVVNKILILLICLITFVQCEQIQMQADCL